jgi:uncharacterized protein (TIGR03435 family)
MTGIPRRELLAIGASLLAAPRGWTQAFEVASIKPSAPGQRGVRIQIAPGGRFVANNVNVKFLIGEAYNIRDFQISGGPSWIGSERYDITAKADGEENKGPEAFRPMVQGLLKDRFQFKSHMETKELPVYHLVVGKNGSKLTENASGPDKGMVRMGRGQVSATGVPIAMLCRQLAMQLGRTVIDKTGLTGDYDFKLEFTPEEGMGPGPGGDAPPPPDTVGPSLFAAIQEQLGLKLDGAKGPVEVLVIDHIEKASEN